MKQYALAAAFAVSTLVFPGYVMAQATDQGGSGGVAGQTQAGGERSGKSATAASGEDRADASFVRRAAEDGLAEVELSQLATRRASSDDVKNYAQHMVEQHTKANEELSQLASSKGIAVPSEPSGKDKATKQRLEKLSGPAFDRAYMDEQVKDHEKDVKEFSKEAKSAKDPDVKKFASSTLSTLQDHLGMAKNVDQTVKDSQPAGTKGTKKGSATGK